MLALNYERYEDEVREGLHEKKKGKREPAEVVLRRNKLEEAKAYDKDPKSGHEMGDRRFVEPDPDRDGL